MSKLFNFDHHCPNLDEIVILQQPHQFIIAYPNIKKYQLTVIWYYKNGTKNNTLTYMPFATRLMLFLEIHAINKKHKYYKLFYSVSKLKPKNMHTLFFFIRDCTINLFFALVMFCCLGEAWFVLRRANGCRITLEGETPMGNLYVYIQKIYDMEKSVVTRTLTANQDLESLYSNFKTVKILIC